MPDISDAANREIRLAFWKLHILHHAASQPVYGLWMLRELASHGHHLSPGTLYPLLARMEANGWLRSTARGAGRARRPYRLTREGRRLLGRLKLEIAELHREVVLGEDPEHETVPRSRRGKR